MSKAGLIILTIFYEIQPYLVFEKSVARRGEGQLPVQRLSVK